MKTLENIFDFMLAMFWARVLCEVVFYQINSGQTSAAYAIIFLTMITCLYIMKPLNNKG